LVAGLPSRWPAFSLACLLAGLPFLAAQSPGQPELRAVPYVTVRHIAAGVFVQGEFRGWARAGIAISADGMADIFIFPPLIEKAAEIDSGR
jgi:hypothetical protein